MFVSISYSPKWLAWNLNYKLNTHEGQCKANHPVQMWACYKKQGLKFYTLFEDLFMFRFYECKNHGACDYCTLRYILRKGDIDLKTLINNGLWYYKCHIQGPKRQFASAADFLLVLGTITWYVLFPVGHPWVRMSFYFCAF